ncbi:MAG: molybdopterin-synthase adenylyltransferase MoeB [Candidatus Omnitrophica bacterium]|nr:molybdopterin-synthase adenylyltransferase MoeB [Candidatus Omnitrophota bacterium]
MSLSDEQIERYSRHILLNDVGVDGQERISAGKVLIIGAGGLGSPVALYLAAAGVGTLGLADSDKVDLSNLQRQVIHFTPDVGRPKVLSARDKIKAINPDVKVNTYEIRVNAANIAGIIKDYDFIVDGTDNFAAKFLINDACVLGKKPFSHGGILRFEGQTMTFVPGSACYRCVFTAPPSKGVVPNCSQSGILGAVAGMLGTIQATEVLRFLLGKGDLLVDRLLIVEAMNMNFRVAKFSRRSDCPVCGDHPSITDLFDENLKECDV